MKCPVGLVSITWKNGTIGYPKKPGRDGQDLHPSKLWFINQIHKDLFSSTFNLILSLMPQIQRKRWNVLESTSTSRSMAHSHSSPSSSKDLIKSNYLSLQVSEPKHWIFWRDTPWPGNSFFRIVDIFFFFLQFLLFVFILYFYVSIRLEHGVFRNHIIELNLLFQLMKYLQRMIIPGPSA